MGYRALTPVYEGPWMFLRISEVVRPSSHAVSHYADRYWCVDSDHEAVVFFNPANRRGRRTRRFGSPQCSDVEAIARRVNERGIAAGRFEVRFLPSVFIPLDFLETYQG